MFYPTPGVQPRGAANYGVGLGSSAVAAFRPSDGGASQMGASAITGRSNERASAFDAMTRGATAAAGYAAQLKAAAGQTMGQLAGTLATNKTREKLYDKEIDYLKSQRKEDRSDKKKALLLTGAAGLVGSLGDLALFKPKKTEPAPLPEFRMPELPSFS